MPDPSARFDVAGAYPVLDGLNVSRVSGKEIAYMTGVSPSTVSKWRTGRVRMPAETMVFLTLVLAYAVEEMETLDRRWDWEASPWARQFDDQLHESRRFLRAQEARNAMLAPDAVHGGAQQFRRWLTETGATVPFPHGAAGDGARAVSG